MMDVEQAMKEVQSAETLPLESVAGRVWAGTKYEYPTAARLLKAANTLAAEVRRLQSAVPAGHVRDENGVDRKVLGALPITADECVVGIGALVYEFDADDEPPQWVEQEADHFAHELVCNTENPVEVYAKCYSTRAAAEAARRAT